MNRKTFEHGRNLVTVDENMGTEFFLGISFPDMDGGTQFCGNGSQHLGASVNGREGKNP